MSLAVVHSRALIGLQAPEVRVEVHLANGLPGFTLVGLADTEVKESRERVRAALATSGFGFPHNKRITVSLAPADLPKEGGRFDLPIALGILAAAGQIDAAALANWEFAGELSLAGELRPVRGALAHALAAQRAPQPRELVLPGSSAAEAALAVPERVCSATHLLEVVQAFRPAAPVPIDHEPGDGAGPSAGATAPACGAATEAPIPLPRARPPQARPPGPGAGANLADVRGQAAARRALEIAAAGGHSLLMVGPPGSGKSMLAQRLPGLLPRMTEAEALESAALAGLAVGGFDPAHWRCRPLRSPHHSASAVALVGGGSPPRPGEISLAHGGVLFLDELPEFPRGALEALREPLETGSITISRAGRQATFPAAFQLVAAMNPCPCGWLGAAPAIGRACRCTPDQVARYQGRLSGPLLDRIDLQVEVPAVAPDELLRAGGGEASEPVAERAAAARLRQLERQGCSNARLDAAGVAAHAPPAPGAVDFLELAARRLGWSARALHRTLRIARTVADLAGAVDIEAVHLAEAMQYRRALPAVN